MSSFIIHGDHVADVKNLWPSVAWKTSLKFHLNLDGSKVDSAIQFLHQFAAESVPHNQKTGYKRIPSSTGAKFCSKVASSNISILIQELSHFNTRDICDGQG